MSLSRLSAGKLVIHATFGTTGIEFMCYISNEFRSFPPAYFGSIHASYVKEAKTMATRPPLPPFTHETAAQKVHMAEDGWNSRDPEKVSLSYSVDSRWRNRAEFVNGRQDIVAFLSRKWAKELDYRLKKELWAFTGNRIAVRSGFQRAPSLASGAKWNSRHSGRTRTCHQRSLRAGCEGLRSRASRRSRRAS